MQKDAATVVKKQMFNNSKWTLHQDSLEITGHDLNVKNNSGFKRRILLEKKQWRFGQLDGGQVAIQGLHYQRNPIETRFISLVKGKLGTDELLPKRPPTRIEFRPENRFVWRQLLEETPRSTRRESVKRQNALSEGNSQIKITLPDIKGSN